MKLLDAQLERTTRIALAERIESLRQQILEVAADLTDCHGEGLTWRYRDCAELLKQLTIC